MLGSSGSTSFLCHANFDLGIWPASFFSFPWRKGPVSLSHTMFLGSHECSCQTTASHGDISCCSRHLRLNVDRSVYIVDWNILEMSDKISVKIQRVDAVRCRRLQVRTVQASEVCSTLCVGCSSWTSSSSSCGYCLCWFLKRCISTTFQSTQPLISWTSPRLRSVRVSRTL